MKIEIRNLDDGSLDEIVVTDASGKCIMHLEKMDVGQWWMGIYGKKTVHVNFISEDTINVSAEEDE